MPFSTADTVLGLDTFFKIGAAFWMNIRARFDLETAEDLLAPQIKKMRLTTRREIARAEIFFGLS